ncbi:hypothetical protein SprV_0301319200 [Sparganum proliferum]
MSHNNRFYKALQIKLHYISSSFERYHFHIQILERPSKYLNVSLPIQQSKEDVEMYFRQLDVERNRKILADYLHRRLNVDAITKVDNEEFTAMSAGSQDGCLEKLPQILGAESTDRLYPSDGVCGL